VRALILAGGAGTRLRSTIGPRPKPMAPIDGKPFLEYLIAQLASWGERDITLCIGYLGEQIKKYFGTGAHWSVRIDYSEENIPLDTGGAVRQAMMRYPDDNFLVMNGDSYLRANAHEVISFHLRLNAVATIALARLCNSGRYGAVELSKNFGIKSFKEKNPNASGVALINGGIYVLSRTVLDFIPEGKISLEKDVFPMLIGKGLYGVRSDGFFIDIGIPQDYMRLFEHPELISEIIWGLKRREP
jgi:D-glycero-alpha-D-manno-heptose 1-phosphate guanylyltransferase